MNRKLKYYAGSMDLLKQTPGRPNLIAMQWPDVSLMMWPDGTGMEFA